MILIKLIQELLPVTHETFTKHNINVDIFLYEVLCSVFAVKGTETEIGIQWILTLFAKSLPLEIASRIWDRYILQGEVFFFLFLSSFIVG